MNRRGGFTLIELIVTLAIAAIVLTVGIPSFRELLRENRLATQANEFLAALALTRSEALKRGVRVTLCKSADGASCTANGGYEQGWVVFVDPNNNATVDTGEVILRVYGALPGGFTLTGNTNVRSYVSYAAGGMSQLISGAFQAGTLTLCAAPKARSIAINSTGRARIAVATC
jgi:type IV fimbrial biogenesis protein FimT